MVLTSNCMEEIIMKIQSDAKEAGPLVKNWHVYLYFDYKANLGHNC